MRASVPSKLKLVFASTFYIRSRSQIFPLWTADASINPRILVAKTNLSYGIRALDT